MQTRKGHWEEEGVKWTACGKGESVWIRGRCSKSARRAPNGVRAGQAGSTDVKYNTVSGSSPQESCRYPSLPIQSLDIPTALCLHRSPKFLEDLKRVFSLEARVSVPALLIPNPRLLLRHTTKEISVIDGV